MGNNALGIPTGTTSSLAGTTLPSGQIVWNTDTKKIHAGDGTTAGGVIIGTGEGGTSDLATETTPGLMSSADKAIIDHLYTPEEVLFYYFSGGNFLNTFTNMAAGFVKYGVANAFKTIDVSALAKIVLRGNVITAGSSGCRMAVIFCVELYPGYGTWYFADGSAVPADNTTGITDVAARYAVSMASTGPLRNAVAVAAADTVAKQLDTSIVISDALKTLAAGSVIPGRMTMTIARWGGAGTGDSPSIGSLGAYLPRSISALGSVIAIPGGVTTTPTASQVIGLHVVDTPFVLPANLNGSRLRTLIAPTASTVIQIAKNGVNVASATVGNGLTDGAFSNTATPCAAGDLLTVTMPATTNGIGAIAYTLLGIPL